MLLFDGYSHGFDFNLAPGKAHQRNRRKDSVSLQVESSHTAATAFASANATINIQRGTESLVSRRLREECQRTMYP